MGQPSKRQLVFLFLGLVILASAIYLSVFLYSEFSINEQSRKTHVGTSVFCTELYVETFCVREKKDSRPAVNADWLTDSLSFRIFIGSYDTGHGGISFGCAGDTIYVSRWEGNEGKQKKIPERKFFLRKELMELKNLNRRQ
jgi:hypothetical protein